MFRKMLTTTALVALGQGAYAAPITVDEVVSELEAQGYTVNQVKSGMTRIKVKAIGSNGERLEVVYNKENGDLLKREVEFYNTGAGTGTGGGAGDPGMGTGTGGTGTGTGTPTGGGVGNLSGGPITAEDVVAALEGEGYRVREVKSGMTRIKVEAIGSNGEELEVVYNKENGDLLKREVDYERDDDDDDDRYGTGSGSGGYDDDDDDDYDDDRDDDRDDDHDDDDHDDDDDDDDDHDDDDHGGGDDDDDDDDDD